MRQSKQPQTKAIISNKYADFKNIATGDEQTPNAYDNIILNVATNRIPKNPSLPYETRLQDIEDGMVKIIDNQNIYSMVEITANEALRNSKTTRLEINNILQKISDITKRIELIEGECILIKNNNEFMFTKIDEKFTSIDERIKDLEVK